MSFTITPLLMRAGREERRKEEQQELPDSSRLISWAYPRFFKHICDRLLIKVNTSLQTFRCAEFLSQLCTMWARDEPRMGRLNAFVAFPEKFSSVIFLVHVPIMLHSCLICCTAMKSVSFSPFLGRLKFWCVFPPPGRVLCSVYDTSFTLGAQFFLFFVLHFCLDKMFCNVVWCKNHEKQRT